jgi:hypothetical protein
LGNIALVVLTAVFVLRLIARNVKESEKLNENAIPFLVFALVIMYIAGQVVLIIGSVGTPQSQDNVNLTSNSILLVSGILYYIWYSQFALQRKGYIKRKLLTMDEVNMMIKELRLSLKESVPSESEIIEDKIDSILDDHRIEYLNKD